MHDLLIYVSNPEQQSEIETLFPNPFFRATLADVPEKVVSLCQEELFDVALVWHVGRQNTRDFFNILEANQFTFLPVVAIIENSSQIRELVDLPLSDFLQLPMPREVFWSDLQRIVDDTVTPATVLEGVNWQGSLEEYNLVDLIQMLESAERDGELVLHIADQSGVVQFLEGNIINAQFINLQGLPALLKMAFWQKGRFSTRLRPLKSPKKIIDKNNRDILMLLVSKLHEWENLIRQLPELSQKIVANPLREKQERPPLQERILETCQDPISISDLLMRLPDANELILSEVKTLLANRLVGAPREIKQLIYENEAKGGFGKLVHSLSSMFKKKKDDQPYQETDTTLQNPVEELPPQLKVSIPRLTKDQVETIHQRLEQYLS